MNCGGPGSQDTVLSQNGGEPYGGTAIQPTYVDLASPCPSGFYSHVIKMLNIDDATVVYKYSFKDCNFDDSIADQSQFNWSNSAEQFSYDGRTFTLLKSPTR